MRVQSPPSKEPTNLRILCADDDPFVGRALECVLKSNGYVVQWVRDGMDALDRLISAPDAFDVLLTDHEMPRMNGLQLVSELRKLGFEGQVFVHSSLLTPLIVQAYRALGVQVFLSKPVSLASLLGALEAIWRP